MKKKEGVEEMTHPVPPPPLQPQTVTGVLCPPYSQTKCYFRAGGNPCRFLEGHASSWPRNLPSLAQCWPSTPFDPPLMGDDKKRRGASPLCTPQSSTTSSWLGLAGRWPSRRWNSSVRDFVLNDRCGWHIQVIPARPLRHIKVGGVHDL